MSPGTRGTPLRVLRRSAAILLGACILSSAATPASPQDLPASVHLEPARVEAVAEPGLQMGPFTIANLTGARYAMRVQPVLLGQRRDGGLYVREEPASLARARRLLAASAAAFDFPPGYARSVYGQVRRLPAGGGIYGGILFRATPRRAGAEPAQIRSILQLTARVLLDPPPSRRRERWIVGSLMAEQAGERRLRLLAPVTNEGNVLTRVSGRLRVRDSGGRVVAGKPVQAFEVLPGATVELPATLASPRLGAGGYTVEADLRAGGRRLSGSSPMELMGVNEVRTERARLLELPALTAYIGEPTKIEASFENTGNVEFAPKARVEAQSLGEGQRGRIVASAPMRGERVDPGESGRLTASLELPETGRSFELRVRLVREGRETDSRAISVTPVKRPPLATRIGDSITEHAVVIVLSLVAAFLGLGAAALRRIRRLNELARR